MRSLYPNTNKELWPNQFVSTRVILTTFPNSVLIPVEAVVYTTEGPFAYVINKENIAEKRKLILGQQLGEKIIVKKGINKGENIVIEGQINLANKIKVRITKKGS